MKYRLYNQDGSPTTLVYDTLFKANYMVNMLSHWTQTHLGIKEEPESEPTKLPGYLPGYGAPKWEHLPP